MDVPGNDLDSGNRAGAPALRGSSRAPRAPGFARRAAHHRSAPAALLRDRGRS
jgi:hypothetical protein